MGKMQYKVKGTTFEVDDRYEVKKKIGQGAYGLICAATDRANGETVAQSTKGVGEERICVNTGYGWDWYPTLRASDWAVAEIITWDYALSLEEIEDVELHLGNRFSLAPTPQPTPLPASSGWCVIGQPS